MILKRFFLAGLIVIFSSFATVFSQQAKLAPFQVKRSTLIERIKSLKAANSKMTPPQLAEAANALLDTNGIGFVFSFDSTTCERIKKVRDERKDPTTPIRLGATLKSVDAENASLALPEPQFADAICGDCYIELPILQITDSDFVTVVSGRNIKFILPTNFVTNEAFLLDAKDGTTVKRKWRIPYRTVPIGVSFDENILYLGFGDADLTDLSLAIFGEGVFQIAMRSEAEDGGKGKAVEIKKAAADIPTAQQVRFDRWEHSYIISYKKPCDH